MLFEPNSETSNRAFDVLTTGTANKILPPDKLHVYTHNYGETVSTIRPGFEDEAQKLENKYEVEVPYEIMKICKELHGLGGKALLVGGSVRDSVVSVEHPELKIKPKDFDLEVYGIDVNMLELVLRKTFGGDAVDVVGRSFGIMKVRIDGWDQPLDFSIPHRFLETEIVDPTMNVKEAARNRDLKINSLAYDPLTKILYDPFGGVENIQHKIIEVTDNESFQRDSLRVLRIMQLASRLEFDIPQETKQLCKQMVERGAMDLLPRERIAEELKKLLTKGRKPSIGLEFVKEIGFIERYWPELHKLSGVPQEKDWHPEGDVWTHSMQVVDAAAEIAEREIKEGKMIEDDKLILVAAALLHDVGKPGTTEYTDGAFRSRGHEQAGVKPTETFLERIFGEPKAHGVSQITKRVLPLVAEHLKPKEFWVNETQRKIRQDNALRRLAARLNEGDDKSYPIGGGSSLYMLGLIAEADQRGRNGKENKPLRVEEVENLSKWQKWLFNKTQALKIDQKPPVKLLKGQDVLDAFPGTFGGVWLGELLHMVFEDQLDGKISTYEEALSAAKAYYEIIFKSSSSESLGTSIKPQNQNNKKKKQFF